MLSSKKVVFISNYYYPHIGGVENHIQKITEKLPPSYQFFLLTEKHDPKLSNTEQFKNITVLRFSYPKIKYLGLLFIWIKILKYIKLFLSADIIHIHDVFIWFLPYRLILFWKRVYTTFHGWEGKYPIPKNSILQKKLAWYLSTKTIGVGSYISKYYKIRPTLTIYGGVTISKFRNKKKVKSIIFLGRLSKDTGVDLLLNLYENNKNILPKIIFCGDGEYHKRCSLVGDVKGFVKKPEYYLEKYDTCISGGYLSTMSSIYFRCRTIVIINNHLRKDAFLRTPFKKFISLCRNEDELLNAIKETTRNRNLEIGHRWACTQSWEIIANKYIAIWT